MAAKMFSNVSNKVPLSVEKMAKHLRAITGGWPKKIGEGLFGLIGGRVCLLEKPAGLFAFVSDHAVVQWSRAGLTKEEFFEGLRQGAAEYDWSCDHPHFPPLPRVYYGCGLPSPKQTGALENLLGRYRPATPADRQLLKGFVLTLFSDLPPGRRPAFVFTTNPSNDPQRGCGAGKTSTVETLSELVGGCYTVRPGMSRERVVSGLLSPGAYPLRVALVDNLKSYHFSDTLVESLVTCTTIDGHRLYQGHATRPNYLTWAVTVNGASFSRDMAQRSVVVLLRRWQQAQCWYTETVEFIRDNRKDILADIHWHLTRPAQAIGKTDRWQEWCRHILARLENPKTLLERLEGRRSEIDDDDQEAVEVLEYVRDCLRRYTGQDPDVFRWEIPGRLLAEWVRELRREKSANQILQWLKLNQSDRLRYRQTNRGHRYVWTGRHASEDGPVMALEYTPPIRRRGEA